MYPPEIPKNYLLAKGVLYSLLKKYSKEQQYLQACNEIFEHQPEQGITPYLLTSTLHTVPSRDNARKINQNTYSV